MSEIDKLEICKQTRKFAAQSLYIVLKKLLKSQKPISEVILRDIWLSEMRKNKNIFPDGWYTPPPHGMIILFGDDKNIQRFDYRNARQEESWPREDVFLARKNAVIFCYASPVDNVTGIIGDFGITLYFGNNADMKQLLKTCLRINQDTFQFAKIGMRISEVTIFAEKQMDKYGMTNQIISYSDKTLKNIGHSIPATNEGWTDKEKKILSVGLKNWISAKDVISKKRFFVNAKEQIKIKPGVAFTIEPRPKVIDKPNLPSSLNYHTIAIFKENGEKELLTNFDDLFTLAGMSYMM